MRFEQIDICLFSYCRCAQWTSLRLSQLTRDSECVVFLPEMFRNAENWPPVTQFSSSCVWFWPVCHIGFPLIGHTQCLLAYDLNVMQIVCVRFIHVDVIRASKALWAHHCLRSKFIAIESAWPRNTSTLRDFYTVSRQFAMCASFRRVIFEFGRVLALASHSG